MQAERRAQAVVPCRAGGRVQEEDLEKAEDQVRGEDREKEEDQGRGEDLEQEEDQNPHSVLFLAHNQDQLRQLE